MNRLSAEPFARIAANAHHGVSVEEIMGRSRRRRISHARWHAWALARSAGWSYPEIGEAFGGKHHTSIIHGVREFKALREASE